MNYDEELLMNYETVTPENIANIIRWNDFETSEELYLHEHSITVPVCEFDGCTEPAKFKSYFLGYFTYCSFNKHKKALKHRAFLKTLETKRKLLEEKTKRDTRTGCCVYCKKDFEYNVNERRKIYCRDKGCITFHKHNSSVFNEFIDSFKNKHEFLQVKKYKLTSEWTPEYIYEYCYYKNKYGVEIALNWVKQLNKEFDGVLLTKNTRDTKYFLPALNGIHVECLMNKCHVCGTKYTKYELRYSWDGAMSVKRVNALYSCSIKCYREICSNKKKYYTYKESAKIKQSKTMKDKIKKGTFTVNTNCWYDNKYKVDGCEFRSSWEVYFYIYHKMNGNLLKYEHKIIQYYDTTLKSLRNYITDFVDPVSKKIYEVKPKSQVLYQNNKDKEEYAREWCEANGYSYLFITEDWFNTNYDEELLMNCDFDERLKARLLKLLNCFKHTGDANED